MTKQLTKQTIGVGVAGTGFIGPAHIEGLRRNGIQVLGLAEDTPENAGRRPLSWVSPVPTVPSRICWPTQISTSSILPHPTYCTTPMPKPPCWPASMWSVRNRWR